MLRVQAVSDVMAALPVLMSSWARPETRHSRPEEGEHKALLCVALVRSWRHRCELGLGGLHPLGAENGVSCGCRGSLPAVPPGLVPTRPSRWGQLPTAGPGIDGERSGRLQTRRLYGCDTPIHHEALIIK